MRPEHLYLLDIVEAAGNVALHMAEQDREGFLGNVTARAAVLHELTVIGEGAARLSEDFRWVRQPADSRTSAASGRGGSTTAAASAPSALPGDATPGRAGAPQAIA